MTPPVPAPPPAAVRQFACCFLLAGMLAAAAPADGPRIPFPDALDAAAIKQEKLAATSQHALLVGNGDINGMVHAHGRAVVLRLTKNDV